MGPNGADLGVQMGIGAEFGGGSVIGGGLGQNLGGWDRTWGGHNWGDEFEEKGEKGGWGWGGEGWRGGIWGQMVQIWVWGWDWGRIWGGGEGGV